jgi:DNA (cytosine-5)-methyltransferase 1
MMDLWDRCQDRSVYPPRISSFAGHDIFRKISCVDLFCGAGGLTHGFKLERLPVAAGVDIDPACRYPYEINNGALFVEKNITELTSNEVDHLFDPSDWRVLAGCAPCQPFSTYSRRYDHKRDGKWSLLYEFLRLVEELHPDIVTIENVAALERYQVFKDFVSTLIVFGYCVWHKVIDCADYGVPQNRKRLVLLASLHGPLQLVSRTHEPHQWRTVRESIADLPKIAAGGQWPCDLLHTASQLSPLNLKRIQASKPGGSWCDWPKHLVAACHRSVTGRTYPSVYGRMEWDKPAPTMTTQCHGYGNGRFGHPQQDRAISLREAAILQSFPRTYRFVRPCDPIQFSVVGRLIGNAVPVCLGRAIARSILGHLSSFDGQSRI